MHSKFRKRTLETNEIINLYQEGESTTQIAKLANVSPRYIRMLLKENNVEMRPRGSWKRKYKVNEDYFKKWSKNMAYVLGFFIADGMVSSNHQMISFSQKEKYILENIRAELNSDHKITKNNTGVYQLNINSKEIKKDLIEIHGVGPNKSNNIIFPKVPDKYLSHFIRGYFDGDGYINYEKYTVTFVGGSKAFMLTLIHVLKEYGFEPQLQPQGNNFRVHIRGRRSIKVFSDWIYKDMNKNLYLIRKYESFKKEKNSLNTLRDSYHKNTFEAVNRRKMNFLTIYAVVNSIEYTCEYIGIKPSTVKRWINTDDLFRSNLSFVSEEQGEE